MAVRHEARCRIVVCTSKNTAGTEKSGASCRTSRIRSARGRASEYAVDLGSHDEVVLMQSLDLLGLQRDRRITPTEADVRMMAFRVREFTNLLNECKRLPEIAEAEAPLDAMSSSPAVASLVPVRERTQLARA